MTTQLYNYYAGNFSDTVTNSDKSKLANSKKAYLTNIKPAIDATNPTIKIILINFFANRIGESHKISKATRPIG